MEADLKEEYRRLQEQQQRKLERVRQLRESRQQQQPGGDFGVGDDLQLRTAAPPPAAAREDVQELRDRVRSLDDENARVKKLLAEKDFETTQLRKKLASQRQRPPGSGEAGEAGDAAAARVMELSRRVRELTAELTSERHKTAHATRRLREAEAKAEEAARPPDCPEKPPLPRAEKEELETELRRVRERLSETRSLYQSSQRDLKMARKALADETGLQDATAVHDIIAGQSNWRGRQQQILALERQVKELKRQLAAQQQQEEAPDPAKLELVTSNGATTLGRELLSHAPAASSSSSSTFRSGVSAPSGTGRQHAALQRMQKERREKAEAELREKKELEKETAELRRRVTSEKARAQTLSQEAKALRAQVETLLKKGKHDDELIESMTRREKGLRELLDQNEAMKSRVENSQRSLVEQVNQQKAQESQILIRMREIVQDKEAIIQAKEEQIEALQQSLTRPDLPLPRAALMEEAEVQTNGLTARDDDGKKPPPSSSRPPSSRGSARSAISSTPVQRPPSRPGSAASSRSLSSSRRPGDAVDLEDARIQLRASEVERDRLRELLLVQDARYQEALAARVAAEQQLAGLRRRSANLERQAGQSVAATADMTDVERLMSSEELPVTRATVRQLQEALAMCHEEVETRKQALKSAMEAKQQDVKWLMEIMEKTRHVYLTGIQRVKQQKA